MKWNIGYRSVVLQIELVSKLCITLPVDFIYLFDHLSNSSNWYGKSNLEGFQTHMLNYKGVVRYILILKKVAGANLDSFEVSGVLLLLLFYCFFKYF